MSRKMVYVCLAAALVACGGGDEGGPSLIDTSGADVPATLSTPTDGAMAVAAIRSFVNLTGGLTISGSPFGKAFAKATTTTACARSGSRTFTTDDSTPFAQDGRTEFLDCIDGSGSQRIIQRGVESTRCNDAGAGSQCQDESFFAGDNGAPLWLEIDNGVSDQRLLLLGAGRQTTSGDNFATGIQQFDNLVSHKSATRVFDNMLMFSSAESGNRIARIGGNFGLNDMARATANCMSGRLSVTTPQDRPLVIDQNENFNGGVLHFTSANGGRADVTFQSGGSISVSVNGGVSTTFSASQLAAFCSIQ